MKPSCALSRVRVAFDVCWRRDRLILSWLGVLGEGGSTAVSSGCLPRTLGKRLDRSIVVGSHRATLIDTRADIAAFPGEPVERVAALRLPSKSCVVGGDHGSCNR